MNPQTYYAPGRFQEPHFTDAMLGYVFFVCFTLSFSGIFLASSSYNLNVDTPESRQVQTSPIFAWFRVLHACGFHSYTLSRVPE